MKPEIKAVWVQMLRTGYYVQGTGALCKQDADGSRRYCCLGVLTDMHARATPDPGCGYWLPAGIGNAMAYCCNDTNDNQQYILHDVVKEWAGLSVEDDDPFVMTKDGARRLTLCNDGNLEDDCASQEISPMTFDEIADAIEASL